MCRANFHLGSGDRTILDETMVDGLATSFGSQGQGPVECVGPISTLAVVTAPFWTKLWLMGS
jgi:hypothetical protein